jgi:peroxiredoxin Q/BCP
VNFSGTLLANPNNGSRVSGIIEVRELRGLMSEVVQRLEAGAKAPEFALPDQDGKTISLASLSGQKAVLYFYPAAGSPGCTKEAADFQEALGEFSKLGYRVIGISPDSVNRLKEFEDAHELTFSLLSDPEVAAHKAFGAFGEKSLYGRLYRGTLRSTIIINDSGVVEHALYNVKATGHVNMLLKKLA